MYYRYPRYRRPYYRRGISPFILPFLFPFGRRAPIRRRRRPYYW